jgi:peptide/nickel transport system ATP-binding protein
MDAIAKRGRKKLRRRAQMIFQNPFDVFDARHRIGRILTDAMALHSIGGDKAERQGMAIAALENSGLRPGADFMRRWPGELSGGQLQRISILRSMLLCPDFVVADEPVSMLDVSVRADIINMLRRLAREKDMAVLFISHDIATTKYIADRIAVMYLGQVVELGKTADVIGYPKHPYTKALISNCPSADPRMAFEPMRLSGDPPSPAALPPGCYFSPRCAECVAECRVADQDLRETEDGRLVRCFRAV